MTNSNELMIVLFLSCLFLLNEKCLSSIKLAYCLFLLCSNRYQLCFIFYHVFVKLYVKDL